MAGPRATDAYEPRQIRKEAAISKAGCVAGIPAFPGAAPSEAIAFIPTGPIALAEAFPATFSHRQKPCPGGLFRFLTSNQVVLLLTCCDLPGNSMPLPDSGGGDCLGLDRYEFNQAR